MGFLSDNKPHTAVTSTIERMTSEQYEEDDIGEIVELLEIINIQPTGPTEAARAIRKKLKYGSKHKQLRALTLMDALVQNGGRALEPLYSDDMLLERLRQTCLDPLTDQRVKRKIQTLATVWAREYSNDRTKDRLAHLHRNLPSLGGKSGSSRRRTVGESDYDNTNSNGESSTSRSKSKNNRNRAYSNPNANEYAPGVTSSSSGKRKKSSSSKKKIDMAAERPKLNTTIAEANTAATNLKNALQLVNRDHELSTENAQATKLFERCKKLRRQILRYIQVVENEEYIGSLIHANEELISALKVYEKMSKPLGEDSDSDWNIESKTRHLTVSDDSDNSSFASDSENEQDASNPDNPFDDSHRVTETPVFEKPAPF